MSDLGLNQEEFHAITWFTSWAVDADHHSEISGNNSGQHLELMYKVREFLYLYLFLSLGLNSFRESK